MHIGKLLGWGIVIYAVMYLVVAGLAVYQIDSGLLSRTISLLVLVALGTLAGLSLKRHSALDIVPYSLVWMLEVIALDLAMSAPYAGISVLLDWNVWVGYSLVFLVPLFAHYPYRHTVVRREV